MNPVDSLLLRLEEGRLCGSLPACLSYQLLGCVPAASCVDSGVIAIGICHMKGEETGVPKKADEE